MITRSILLLSAIGLLLSCNKKAIDSTVPDNTVLEEHFHGYLFIQCETPPYHLNVDSLIANCSSASLLPDNLPTPISHITGAMNACSFDYNNGLYGSAGNFDVRFNYEGTSISFESSLPNSTQQTIPIEICGSIYTAGEYPYLGGIRLKNDELELVVQVVNEYIGGCFHNAVYWELTQF